MSVFLPDQPTIQEMTHSTSPISPHHLLRARNTQSVLGRSRQLQQASGNNLNRTATAAAQIAAEEGMGPLDQYGLRQSAERVQQWHQGPGRFAAYHAYHQRAVQAAAAKAGGSGGSGQGSRRLGAASKALLGAAGLGGASELLGSLGGWGAAALGVGYVGSQVRSGWQNYRTQGTAFSALSRAIGDLGESFNTLRDQANTLGTSFAETLPTITQVVQTYAPYVGDLRNKALVSALNASQGLAFSYGLNPVTTTQAFGHAAQMGITATGGSAGQMTPPQWAALIANATAQGQMQGRTGQVLASMLSVSQNIAQQIAQAPNQNILAGIMTAMNRSGNAMLQGTNGAATLNSMNQGIVSPGNGSAGELAMLTAINPNRKLSYWQTRYVQDQGLTGVNPQTGTSNFTAILRYFQKMLPGGTVQGSTKNGIFTPTNRTAAVAAELSGQLFHTINDAPKALQILKAFQGHSAAEDNKTTQLAQQLGGPNAVQTLLHKGAIGVFGQIANATTVHQLTSAAHSITQNLHGHVSSAFYTAQKQYEALGHAHPTSLKQAQAISHQRAVDFHTMQQTLGKGLLGGPTLGTSMDNLNKTIAATQKNWTKIAQNLTPLVHYLSKIALAISEPKKTLTGGMTGKYSVDLLQWLLNKITGSHVNLTGPSPKHVPHPAHRTSGLPHPGMGGTSAFADTAYQPWIGTPSTATPSAQLADFVIGNMQAATNLPFQSSPGNGNGSGATLASYHVPSSAQAFIRQMQPYAKQVAASTGLSPAVLLSQWALESNWGTSQAARQNANLGGIKPWGSYGPGQDSAYAGYSSLSAFARGDAAFYNQNSNYAALERAARNGASPSQQIAMLGQSGYATDPAYAQKLLSVLQSIDAALANGNGVHVQMA